jgi:hypothetical protein
MERGETPPRLPSRFLWAPGTNAVPVLTEPNGSCACPVRDARLLPSPSHCPPRASAHRGRRQSVCRVLSRVCGSNTSSLCPGAHCIPGGSRALARFYSVPRRWSSHPIGSMIGSTRAPSTSAAIKRRVSRSVQTPCIRWTSFHSSTPAPSINGVLRKWSQTNRWVTMTRREAGC